MNGREWGRGPSSFCRRPGSGGQSGEARANVANYTLAPKEECGRKRVAVAARAFKRGGTGEAGRIGLLSVALAGLVLVLVLGTTVLTNLHLERKRLLTLADLTASHAATVGICADSHTIPSGSSPRLCLDPAKVEIAAKKYLMVNASGYMGSRVVELVDVQVVNDSVVVTLQMEVGLRWMGGELSALPAKVTISVRSAAGSSAK